MLQNWTATIWTNDCAIAQAYLYPQKGWLVCSCWLLPNMREVWFPGSTSALYIHFFLHPPFLPSLGELNCSPFTTSPGRLVNRDWASMHVNCPWGNCLGILYAFDILQCILPRSYPSYCEQTWFAQIIKMSSCSFHVETHWGVLIGL